MTTGEATAPARPAGDLRNYVLVTAACWADTLADGAIRLLVLFYFVASATCETSARICAPELPPPTIRTRWPANSCGVR